MSVKTAKTAAMAKVRTAKQRKALIATNHKTNEDIASPQPTKTTQTKRATAEEINKANALMMKAWDMISQRKNLEVDD